MKPKIDRVESPIQPCVVRATPEPEEMLSGAKLKILHSVNKSGPPYDDEPGLYDDELGGLPVGPQRIVVSKSRVKLEGSGRGE